MKPITVIIPDHSEQFLLSPSSGAAVCIGNVLTSQRIVVVTFNAFHVCAASQRCINNFAFRADGENGFRYYEAIVVGSGAGLPWNGIISVHTNMANRASRTWSSLSGDTPLSCATFISARLRCQGANAGSDGVVQDMDFRLPVSASIP